MYNEQYEHEIDLKDLLFAVLYQWRLIFVVALCMGVGIGVIKGLNNTSQVISEDVHEIYEIQLEQYETDKQLAETNLEILEVSLESAEDYVLNSPKMKMNPYEVSYVQTHLVVEFESDKFNNILESILASYQSALLNGEYLEDVAQELNTETQYIEEILSVTRESDSNENAIPKSPSFFITVIGSDVSMAKDVMEIILDELNRLHPEMELIFGDHTVTLVQTNVGTKMDISLIDYQKEMREYVTTISNTMQEEQKKLDALVKPVLTEATMNTSVSLASMVKYGLLGFVAGGFVSVLGVAVMFVLNDKLTSDKEVKNRFGLKNLGTFSVQYRQKVFGGIDELLRKIEGTNVSYPEDVVYEMIVTNIRNYAGEKKNLVLSGLASEEILQKVASKITEMMPEYSFEIAGNTIESASSRKSLAETEGVVLIEERNQTTYTQIQQELELAKNVDVEVIGFIIV